MRKLAAALVGAAAIVVALGQPASAQQKCTIALIPGLTTDAFYITMRKGARGGGQGGRRASCCSRARRSSTRSCRCRCSRP